MKRMLAITALASILSTTSVALSVRPEPTSCHNYWVNSAARKKECLDRRVPSSRGTSKHSQILQSQYRRRERIWRPEPGTTFEWQLDTPVNLEIPAEVYDIELFDNDARTVRQLHARGRKVICYISVGSWENWRPDRYQFPESVIGKPYEGWEGERWLDIRQIDLLAPVMGARLDECQAKGFDGVEPDNIDGYQSETGFSLTPEAQFRYNRWIAEEAHARGLSIGLKNDGEQASVLEPYFDWALTEDCYADDWCEDMEPFIEAGKAVFMVEYTDNLDEDEFFEEVCPYAEKLGYTAILKDRDLDDWSERC